MARKKKPVDRWTAQEDALVSNGWRTPNTYDKHFETTPNAPGVYLFLVFPDGVLEGAPVVAYVGKSRRLRQRLVGHPIMREIYGTHPRAYIQEWFLKRSAEEISALEVETIRQFNPPYNIQHRRRGLNVAA